MTFAIVRGADDSAPLEYLGFSVESAGIESGMMNFKFKFEYPLMISIGAKKDKMVATIVDGSFFANEDGQPIPPGTEIVQLLPKLLPGEEFAMALESTKTGMERATQTFVIAQIIITLLLSVSLKSMWNLYNVIQILAYIRFFTNWPAFMLDIFMYMDNAITLKPISDPIFEYGKSEFDKAEATLNDENMKSLGVQDTSLAKSLGLYAIVLGGLLIAIGFYVIMRFLCLEKCKGVRTFLQKKLFYGSFIRYMIVSNLKVNYTVTAFLVSSWSFATFMSGIVTSGFIIALIGICFFPVAIIIFMSKNYDRLEDNVFRKKWDALYQGLHTNSKAALMYNSVFCVRRSYIVFANLIFSPGFALTDFTNHQYVFKNMAILFV